MMLNRRTKIAMPVPLCVTFFPNVEHDIATVGLNQP